MVEAEEAEAVVAGTGVLDRIDQQHAVEEADTGDWDGYEGKVEDKTESARPSRQGRMRRGRKHSPVAVGGVAMNSPSERKMVRYTGMGS